MDIQEALFRWASLLVSLLVGGYVIITKIIEVYSKKEESKATAFKIGAEGQKIKAEIENDLEDRAFKRGDLKLEKIEEFYEHSIKQAEEMNKVREEFRKSLDTIEELKQNSAHIEGLNKYLRQDLADARKDLYAAKVTIDDLKISLSEALADKNKAITERDSLNNKLNSLSNEVAHLKQIMKDHNINI